MPQKKLIHVVGGGFHQKALVASAKEMGLRVLVTDMYPDPPARELADLFEQIDTTDREATLACAKKNRIDHVLTDMTDVAVPTAAYIAEALGLPGIGYETSLRFTDKHLMREALKDDFSAHLPESRLFKSAEDALDFYRASPRDGTWVVKPVNSQGSRGVFVLDGSTEDTDALIKAAFAESRLQGVLIERFITGAEYSAETFVRDGRVHNLTLTKKYHYSHNPCLDERNAFLGDVAPELERTIFELNERIIHALGLPFGNTHAEYKVNEDGIFLMEIAARSAGGSIGSRIIPYLTDFDGLRALLKVHTGEPFDITIRDYRERFAVLRFYDFPQGRVKKIFINRNITRDLMVFTLTDYLTEGGEVPPIRDSRDRMGYFVVHGPDREDVLRRERQALSAVRLEYH